VISLKDTRLNAQVFTWWCGFCL